VSYQVWRSSAPYFLPGDVESSIIAEGVGPQCTDDGVTITCVDAGSGGANYAYIVRAFDAAGTWADSNRVGKVEFMVVPGD
jgi:hypothetical protein